MNTDKPTLYEMLPDFSSNGNPADDLQELGDWAEIAEAILRVGEFNELGVVHNQGKTYSIRVNPREYEAPHVHIKIGSQEVRVFLGASPNDVKPDNRNDQYNRIVRNRATRLLILSYVKAHHACLLQAWQDNGNPLHAPGGALEVVCMEHQLPPEEFSDVAAEGLNAQI